MLQFRFPDLKSTWESLRNLPAYTKFLCLIVVFLSFLNWLLYFLFHYAPILSLRAGTFFYQPWTLLTYSLFEKNIITLIGTILCLAASGSLFEPLWGRAELVRFVLIVNVLTGLAYCIFYIIKYLFFNDFSLLMNQEAYGLFPLIASFSVCFKQTYPEQKVNIFGQFGFKIKQLPSYLLTVMTILGLLFRPFTIDMFLCWTGVFISWCYLRFFKIQYTVRGDRSETFSFVSFFPTAIRPTIKIVSNYIFSLLVRLRCCQPIHSISPADLESGRYYIRSLPSTSTSSQVAPVADVERKRALALKDLDERLQLAPVPELLSPDSLAASSSQEGRF